MLPNRKLNRPERDLSEQAFYMEPQTVPDERYITTKHGQVIFAMRCANDKDLVQAADYTGMDLQGVRFRPAVPTYSALLDARGTTPGDAPRPKAKDMPR